MAGRSTSLRAVPKGVVALGVVSLFMDVSSEMIHSLLPVFLVGTLGVSALMVGLIDGLAGAIVSITKLFSGVVSDWVGRRKPLLLAGYGLAALTKPLFPLAGGAGLVFGALLIDRFGKGIRGAPRDALVADITPPEQRGAAYGLRQSMDTVGACLGPVLAIVLMAVGHDDIRYVFAWAVLPAALSVLSIILFVREPETRVGNGARRFPIHREALALLGIEFWLAVALTAVMMMARFSEGFLILRGQNAGIPLHWLPAVLVTMNIVYALSAWPLGELGDRWPRYRLLAFSAVLLLASELLLACDGLGMAIAGTLLWGLHMGASQGLLAALVADSAPASLRGTAFGIFNLVSGVFTFLASGLAGLLWTTAGPSIAYLSGAAFAALTLVGCRWLEKRQSKTQQARTA